MVDVVYPLSSESAWGDNELRYSLRSLQKNFDQLGKVWIIGHAPSWVQNVRHIPFPDPYQRNKDANMIGKAIRVCFEPSLSNKFLFMNDDQCLLKPMQLADFKPYVVENLNDITIHNQSIWHQRLKNTHGALKRSGKTVYNFEGHIPYCYDKGSFPHFMLHHDFGASPGYTINTLYLNQCDLPPTIGHDSMRVKHVRAGFYAGATEEKMAIEFQGKLFLSYNDKGLNQLLKKKIDALFPTKSRFER